MRFKANRYHFLNKRFIKNIIFKENLLFFYKMTHIFA